MHPLESVRDRSAAKRRIRSAKVERAAPGSIALRRCGDACAVPPLEMAVQAIRLSPYRAGLAGRHRKRLLRSPASLTGSCPLQLSPSGQSDGPEVFLRTSPGCTRDPTPRPAAHTFIAHGSPGIGDFPRKAVIGSSFIRATRFTGDTKASQGDLRLIVPRTSNPWPPSPCSWLSQPRTTMGPPTL
jgi:hypothetical protein